MQAIWLPVISRKSTGLKFESFTKGPGLKLFVGNVIKILFLLATLVSPQCFPFTRPSKFCSSTRQAKEASYVHLIGIFLLVA